MSMTFHISPNAEQRLQQLMASQEEGVAMRISILGGGCSGFEYKFEFDSKPRTGDTRFTAPNTQKPLVVIDAISAPYLEGATLDYIHEIGKARFLIKNPIADSSCGCGNSFSIKKN